MTPRDQASTATWPAYDIVYLSIVGIVMLAALLEWLLWLMAFLYCLIKVIQKADEESRWATRILAVIHIIIFTIMRCIFLPVMIVTLPWPPQASAAFPETLVSVLQWFAFYTFAALLTIPWLLCIYQLVTHDVGRKRRVKAALDERTAPKVVIMMPCYNEEPDILLRTIESILSSDYPRGCMHIFLSFDGDKENSLFLNTIEKLGVPTTLEKYPRSIDLVQEGCRITVSRFPHGGKRSCQKHTFRLVDRIYQEYLRRNDDIFVLFIDSDCILDEYCIQSFLYEMELKPGSSRNVLAQTGVVTSTTKKNSLLTILQDMEYIHGQLFERTVESGCGAVTCLPGALTILRFSAFRKVARYYFADKAEQCNDIFDYSKMHLGEDRWLTHLFMVSSTARYQIQMNTGAFCKTEAVQTFKSLLKQRRRWFLGFITNEAVMLTDIRLWRRYPMLMLIRLAQNTIRTTALLFLIMVIALLTTSQKVANLPVGFIAISLGLNWALMLYFAARLGRYKIVLFPLMFVVNPFFNWLYMVYGIFTAGQRTWGGPRADASKADADITPSAAVVAAELTGDDLNIVPETFKDASIRLKRTPSTLAPANKLRNRFRPASALPGGWFQQINDSGTLQRHSPRRLRRRRNESLESWSTQDSSSRSPARPRRVESLVRMAATPQQLAQPLLQRSISADSVASVKLHFPIPRHPRHRSTRRRSPDDHFRESPPQSRAWGPIAGKSPLARKSFTKLASDQKTEREVSIARGRASSEEPRGRARHRPRVSIDAQGRRRLSKQRHSAASSP